MTRSTCSSFAAACAVLVLAGCSTLRVPSPPQLVEVPVGVSCLPEDLPVRPDLLRDDELLVLDEYKRPLRIFTERGFLISYADKLEAVLKACK